jgi:hypothetical protein
VPQTYWAKDAPERLASEVLSRWKDWRRYFWHSGIGVKADKGRRYMYGMNDLGETSSRLAVGGTQAHLLKVVLNKIRPVVERSRAMISAQAPTMTPVAANSDSAARQQAISARGILQHVHREHDTDALDNEVLEIAMCMGEGLRLILWDPNGGEPTAIDPSTQQPIEMAGDFYNSALTPFDTAKDPSWRSARGLPWIIVRTWENRWELAATYEEKADAILSATHNDDLGEGYDMRFLATGDDVFNRGDAIPVYRFFHVACRAVKEGRAFACLNNGTWLTDGANPYEGLPVERCTPGGVIATSMGYSNVFDALGVADLLNSLESVIATHTIRWGIPPVVDFVGSGLQHSTLGNGTSVLTVNKPELTPVPLEVPDIPADVFKHAEKLANDIEQALGMNATAMGNPPFSGMAAQAMALLDQKAREYNDGLAKSYDAYKQACATRELRVLKTFADDPRIAVIQGKAKAWMLKSFTKADLAHVDRVAMEPAPAGTGTMAYKMALAETLRGFGVELPPEQIIELLRTGQYESAFEHEEANRLRIKAENEYLQEGKVPPVLSARTHWLDIPEHLALLNSPDITERPEVVDAVLSTVEAKLDAWRSMPPDILALLGGPPPPLPLGPPPLPPAAMEPGNPGPGMSLSPSTPEVQLPLPPPPLEG